MLKNALLLSYSIVFNLHFCAAISVLPSVVGKCDTLITVEGNSYVVSIVREDAREVQFMLCNESNGAKYAIVNDRVLEIRRSNGKVTKPLENYPVKESTPLIKSKPKPIPTPSIISQKQEDAFSKSAKQDSVCQVLTFTDGKSIEVRIIEEDSFNYFYMICGNIDDTVYMVPRKNVRLERKKDPRKRKEMGCLLVGLIVIVLVYLITFAAQLLGG